MKGLRIAKPVPRGLRLATWIGAGLAFWMYQWPEPYRPLMLAAGLSPLAVLILMLFWRGGVSLNPRDEDPNGERVSLAGLWYLPPAALAWRALQDIQLVYTTGPVLAAAGLAVLLTALAAFIDPRSRDWGVPVNLVVGLLWGWGLVTMVNVEFDQSPGRIRPAFVADRYGYDDRILIVSLADQSLTQLKFHVGETTYRRSEIGTPVCVEDNPGLLGWRTLWLVD
eukprot:gene24852-24956_t